jgi:predicted nucleic acid-binding protein
LRELGTLNIELQPQTAPEVFTRCHALASKYNLTAYDAAYLQVALGFNLPLATLDADLVRACKAAGAALVQV